MSSEAKRERCTWRVSGRARECDTSAVDAGLVAGQIQEEGRREEGERERERDRGGEECDLRSAVDS